jgi:hypothetical protein
MARKIGRRIQLLPAKATVASAAAIDRHAAPAVASWFETREDALLTMRV